MPLLDEVTSLAPDRVIVWADDERGRFATADDLLAGATPTTAVYVCGPSGMLESVRMARDEHANAPLHYERFSPAPVVDGIQFELELARSRRVAGGPAYPPGVAARRSTSCWTRTRRRRTPAAKASAGPARSKCSAGTSTVEVGSRNPMARCWCASHARPGAGGWSAPRP